VARSSRGGVGRSARRAPRRRGVCGRGTALQTRRPWIDRRGGVDPVTSKASSDRGGRTEGDRPACLPLRRPTMAVMTAGATSSARRPGRPDDAGSGRHLVADRRRRRLGGARHDGPVASPSGSRASTSDVPEDPQAATSGLGALPREGHASSGAAEGVDHAGRGYGRSEPSRPSSPITPTPSSTRGKLVGGRHEPEGEGEIEPPGFPHSAGARFTVTRAAAR